jgi:hypothetical protein
MAMSRPSGPPDIVIAEIGSTITKTSAFALESGHPRLVGQAFDLTSVAEGDVSLGLDRALTRLAGTLGIPPEAIDSAQMFAAASAAGGLRMSVHGLTRDMTLRAAREASLGAGANIVMTSAGVMSEYDIEDLRDANPNIILLAGGVDYGDKRTVIGNAEKLADAGVRAPVVFAGNRAAEGQVRRILSERVTDFWVVDNVYPRIDELNVAPVREIIHEVFNKHIVTAPGMDKVKERIHGDILPTPGAVLKACEMLAEFLGEVVTVDVGGATTDVHSVTDGSETYRKLQLYPEPRSKRSVEGDLGVYHNVDNIRAAAKGVLGEDFDVPPLAEDEEGKARIAELAQWAVTLAILRHAGTLKVSYGASGRNELVEGRDLTAVEYLVGTGGALTRLGLGATILGRLGGDPSGRALLPQNPRILIDADYIMASAGVLSLRYPDAAAEILKKSLKIDG